MSNSDLRFKNIDLAAVRNRTEVRLVRRMDEFFKNRPARELNSKDICDMYALALNLLPARYVQPGTIVLGDIVHDDDIDKALLRAYERVIEYPKH